MYTDDASTDPSVRLVELSASNLRVCRDPASQAEAEVPSAQQSNHTIACEQARCTCEKCSKTDTGSTDIPRWKRVLDVTCILLSLPLWLPIALLIMLWIKIVSPGAIFFRQERIGFRGRRFLILKFRTMKVNVETTSHERHLEQLIDANCPMTKLDASGDPRIIPGGRILRAMGLDELPQLFNVLRGEMSLVGPRPCTPYEFQRFQAWQQERVNAAPGLTGYWQVNGKNKTTFTEMINMDIFYTEKMSLWLDLSIILRTIPAVIVQLLEVRMGTRAGSHTGKLAADKPFGEQPKSDLA